MAFGLAFVNIAKGGMGPREQDPSDFDVDACARTVREHADIAVGVKTAHYWTQLPWDDVHRPWASVDAAVAAGTKSSGAKPAEDAKPAKAAAKKK